MFEILNHGEINAIVVGILIKFIDDIIDMKLPINSFYLETLKAILILLLSISTQLSGLFHLTSFILLISSNISKKYDNHFWNALTICSFILTILSRKEIIKFVSNLSNPMFLFIIIFFFSSIIIGIFWEDYTFPEEFSLRKLITRGFMILVVGFLIYMYKKVALYFELNLDFIIQIGSALIGYCIFSVITQYIYVCKNIKTKNFPCCPLIKIFLPQQNEVENEVENDVENEVDKEEKDGKEEKDEKDEKEEKQETQNVHNDKREKNIKNENVKENPPVEI